MEFRDIDTEPAICTCNVGLLFYRSYFSNRIENLEYLNNQIFSIRGAKTNPVCKDSNPIHFKTSYPGLVLGTGYSHDYKHENKNFTNEAFKIGFYFDHITGMPIIPGSSIKGLLRSAFPQRILKETTKRSLTETYCKQREAFIITLLQELKIQEDININALENDIFHGMNEQGKPIPLYERNIFFDAIPISILSNNYKDREERLFGNDYITPHKHKDRKLANLDPFTNPEPLKFLKVMPSVKYEFRFKLNDRIISSKNKEKLFIKILETLGIGAKTNVGYGQLEYIDDLKEGQ